MEVYDKNIISEVTHLRRAKNNEAKDFATEGNKVKFMLEGLYVKDILRCLEIRTLNYRELSTTSDQLAQPHDGSPSNAFIMVAEDVITTRQGTTVFGKISSGTIRVGDKITTTDRAGNSKNATTVGIEVMRKSVDVATEGTYVGIILSGLNRDEVEKGQALCK